MNSLSRELARQDAIATQQEQVSMQQGLNSEMETLKRLSSSVSAPTRIGGVGSQRMSVKSLSSSSSQSQSVPEQVSSNIRMSFNKGREPSPLPRNQSILRKGSMGVNSSLKVAPSPRASTFAPARRGSGSPGSRLGSFKTKDRASVSLAEGTITVNENGLVSTAEQEKLMNEINTLRKQLSDVTGERDKLLNDRNQWMSRIKGDNQHLASMLRNVRDAKVRLVEEMDAVQTEKSKYRSLQLQARSENIKSTMYPLDDDDCVISEQRRSLMSPESRREEAGRLHLKLTQLVAQVQDNMLALNEHVSGLVDKAIGYFMEFKQDEVAKTIDDLTSIASSEATNVAAADAVAKSLSEAMIGAVLNKSQAVLQIRAREGIDEAQGLAISAESSANEAKTLYTQNESLKTNLALMRKKYTQLLEKVSGKEMAAAASSNVPHESNHHSATAFVYDEKKKAPSGAMSPKMSDISVKLGADSEVSVQEILQSAKAATAELVNPFESLRFEVKQQANAVISEVINEACLVHPLSKNIKKYMLAELAAEAAASVQPQVGVALQACKETGVLARDGAAANKELEDTIRRVVRSAAIHKQILTDVHLAITYLFQRQKSHDPSVSASSVFTISGSTGGASKGGQAAEEKKVDSVASANFSNVKPKMRPAKESKMKPVPHKEKKDQPPVAKQMGNVFMAATGEEQVTTLAPPDQPASTKNLPSFMKPVPKKVR